MAFLFLSASDAAGLLGGRFALSVANVIPGEQAGEWGSSTAVVWILICSSHVQPKRGAVMGRAFKHDCERCPMLQAMSHSRGC